MLWLFSFFFRDNKSVDLIFSQVRSIEWTRSDANNNENIRQKNRKTNFHFRPG